MKFMKPLFLLSRLVASLSQQFCGFRYFGLRGLGFKVLGRLGFRVFSLRPIGFL